jgi:hypothetical protein
MVDLLLWAYGGTSWQDQVLEQTVPHVTRKVKREAWDIQAVSRECPQ